MSMNVALTKRSTTDGASRVPIRERTVDILREAILRSELKPGQRLVEREFIDRLGVSRTTFREALRQLSSEGLVTVIPQRGARVSAPSLKEAEDLYLIRAALESLAVTRFVECASASELRDLREALNRFERVVQRTTDTVEMLDVKEEFYRVLLRGTRSDVLEQTLNGIKARVRSLRSHSLSKPGRANETVSELRAIVNAIAAGDASLAAELCTRHVLTAGETAIARIRETQGVSADS